MYAEIAARGIVLECCPTSNVVLGVYPSYEEHPLPQLRGCQRLSGRFGDHDVQQSVEIAAGDLVPTCEVATHAVRLRCERAHVRRHELFQLRTVKMLIRISAALGHQPPSSLSDTPTGVTGTSACVDHVLRR